ncbi:hypothetical protein M0R19_05075 [Candidatus Pacearchaeota archaeon]|jgi:hypothetical protein|nr:hypothetical protein [Candidatus Pacearchaeota archaeon]
MKAFKASEHYDEMQLTDELSLLQMLDGWYFFNFRTKESSFLTYKNPENALEDFSNGKVIFKKEV